MNKVQDIFNNTAFDEDILDEISKIPEPRSRYIIAMTPRSGSSYLCDVMKRIKRFGTPDEVLNQQFMPGIMKKIPGRTPEEYLRNIIRRRKTRNGLAGLKASWFQFQNFFKAMADHAYLDDFKYIYLTRRDLTAQAISLYKATATDVFHTNKHHTEETIRKLEMLEYDYNKIEEWYAHIVRQEQGWQQYFYEKRIFPLCITYEDIDEDVFAVLNRIATFVGVDPKNVQLPEDDSIFKKVRDSRNADWACQFNMERLKQKESIAAK